MGRSKAVSRQRGQMVQKGPNKWLLRAPLGLNEDGKRIYDSEVFEGTPTQAQARLGVMLADRDTNSFVKPNDHTVATLWPLYLKEKRNLSANSRAQYQMRADMDILPKLGKVKLSDLDPTMVSSWVSWMEEERQVSVRTIRYSFSLLHALFEQALTWNLVKRNPVRAQLPKKVHTEQQVLSPDHTTALLDNARSTKDPLFPLWSLLIHSGLRPQEALALTWADFDGRRVTVCRALVKAKRGGKHVYEVGTPKTKSGRRVVSVAKECAAALREHQVSSKAIGGLIFQTASGSHLDIANVRKAWLRACKRAGVPQVRLYDTRHTSATLLLLAGVPLKIVSERLGHASINHTADIYSHVSPEMDEGAGDTLGSVLTKARRA
jgi:integrase